VDGLEFERKPPDQLGVIALSNMADGYTSSETQTTVTVVAKLKLSQLEDSSSLITGVANSFHETTI
jgi:hypothetical protein